MSRVGQQHTVKVRPQRSSRHHVQQFPARFDTRYPRPVVMESATGCLKIRSGVTVICISLLALDIIHPQVRTVCGICATQVPYCGSCARGAAVWSVVIAYLQLELDSPIAREHQVSRIDIPGRCAGTLVHPPIREVGLPEPCAGKDVWDYAGVRRRPAGGACGAEYPSLGLLLRALPYHDWLRDLPYHGGASTVDP